MHISRFNDIITFMKLGIIAMSAKPTTIAHWNIITLAAKENDEVMLFISTSDRKRPGEVAILGSDMQVIWQKYLESALPDNVKTRYGGSPVRNAYEAIGELEEANRRDTVTVYAGEEDMEKNFGGGKLKKYFPMLSKLKLIDLHVIPNEFADGAKKRISGTQMRSFIMMGDKKSFMAMLPPVSAKAKNAIWNILSGRKDENMAHKFAEAMLVLEMRTKQR